MFGFNITINRESADRDFRYYIQSIQIRVNDSAWEIAQRIASAIAKNCPVLTGALRNSIRVERISDAEAIVIIGDAIAWYAVIVNTAEGKRGFMFVQQGIAYVMPELPEIIAEVVGHR